MNSMNKLISNYCGKDFAKQIEILPDEEEAKKSDLSSDEIILQK